MKLLQLGITSIAAIMLIFTAMPGLALAAPSPTTTTTPTTTTVTVNSNAAVYIDETNPTTNYNKADASFLRIGKSPEFCGRYETFVRFPDLAVSEGGSVPDDAEILSAKLRLYKDDSTSGNIRVYPLQSPFGEGTVTWNTRPYQGSFIASMTLSSSTGWREINLPDSLVQGWLDNPSSNYGLGIMGSWTDCLSMSFRSDETSDKPGLKLIYSSSTPPPTTTTTTTAPPDTTPCSLTYTVTPAHPAVGDTITVTARATDNRALSYLYIMRGTRELAGREAEGDDETVIEVSYSETAELPSMGYSIVADDLGESPPSRYDFTVPVAGSGSAPGVDVSAEWEFQEVIPEEYRLIEADGQIVTVTATASDPDGIQHLTIFINSVAHDYSYSGPISVTETVSWTNDHFGTDHFSYFVQATDREGLTTSTAPGESYHITARDELGMLWSFAPGIHNFKTPRLSWTRMVQVFGADECWWYEPWDWKDPWALIYYHAGFKNVADKGECFGFSTFANEMYQGRISPSEVEFPKRAFELNGNNSYTREILEARQAAQLGNRAMISRIDQWVTWGAEVAAHRHILDHIEHDLERDVPGIVGVREGDGGHAIVPWMVRKTGDYTARVYVYDSNYNGAVHNASSDFSYFPQFPFLEFGSLDWSYAVSWNATLNRAQETWNDRLFYYTYEDAIGDPMHENRLGDATDAPFVTDQAIPSVIDYLIGVFGGETNTDAYFEDDEGRVTGVKDGKLREEIPGSVALLPMGGDSSGGEIYAVPSDGRLSIHVEGNEAGEYQMGLLGEYSLYTVEDKSIAPGGTDTYVIEREDDAVEHSLRIVPGTADDDFAVRFAHIFDGRVEVLDRDSIGREYILEHVVTDAGDEVTVYPEEGGDGIVVSCEEGDLTFDAVTRSTESADTATGDVTYIPESREPDVTLAAGETATIYPDD
jgi:hypothetical protein